MDGSATRAVWRPRSGTTWGADDGSLPAGRGLRAARLPGRRGASGVRADRVEPRTAVPEALHVLRRPPRDRAAVGHSRGLQPAPQRGLLRARRSDARVVAGRPLGLGDADRGLLVAGDRDPPTRTRGRPGLDAR